MIGDYFEHIYLINLEDRKDRLKLALRECEKMGFTPEVFKAVDGTKEDVPYTNPFGIHHVSWNSRAAALAKTTFRLIEDAQQKEYKSILILEDDIEFHPQINEVVDSCFHEIPDDWEMILFGATHKKQPDRITHRIFRLRQSDCLHCYAMRDTVYDFMKEEIQKMELPIDWITQLKVQSRGTSYCVFPNFAYQRPGFSNIVQKHVNYSFLR